MEVVGYKELQLTCIQNMHPKVLFLVQNSPVAVKAHNVINIKSLYFILLLRLPSELFLLNKAKLPFPLLPFFSSISKAVGAEATAFSPNNKTPKHRGEKKITQIAIGRTTVYSRVVESLTLEPASWRVTNKER